MITIMHSLNETTVRILKVTLAKAQQEVRDSDSALMVNNEDIKSYTKSLNALEARKLILYTERHKSLTITNDIKQTLGELA